MNTIHTISNRFPMGLDAKAERKFTRLFNAIEAFEPVTTETAREYADAEGVELEPAPSFDAVVELRGLPTDHNDVGFDFDGSVLVVTVDGCFWAR